MAEIFRDELLTEEGRGFISRLCNHLQDGDSIEEIEGEFGVGKFRGDTLGRIVLPFPEEFVQDDFKWLLIKRAIPVSPIEDDLAYLLSGQEYVVNSDSP